MHGRKPLTTIRALEFAKLAGFSGLETERLIVLGFSNSENPHIRRYFEELLHGGLNMRDKSSFKADSDALDEGDEIVDPRFLQDLSLTALHAVIDWSGGTLSPSQMCKIFVGFPELSTEEGIHEKLRMLESMKLVVRKDERVEVNRRKNLIAWTGPYRTSSSRVEKLREAFDFPEVRGKCKFGIAILPRRRIDELAERVSMLQNWIFQAESERKKSPAEIRDCLVLRYDFFLTHLLDLRKLGFDPQETEVDIGNQVPGPYRL
ncbi:MAG: hypothetical protein NDJ89_02355 [Oligoflexia bacterium]|nr:hypothetical protein [Oligoflexia bacterium]